MGELVYRKELWAIKDRGRWWDSYCDAVEAEYSEAFSDETANGAETSCAGGYLFFNGGSIRPHSRMYAGSYRSSGRMTGSINAGSLRIGSYRYGSRVTGSGSMRTGSLRYAGSGSSGAASRHAESCGIMSLGYGMQLI